MRISVEGVVPAVGLTDSQFAPVPGTTDAVNPTGAPLLTTVNVSAGGAALEGPPYMNKQQGGAGCGTEMNGCALTVSDTITCELWTVIPGIDWGITGVTVTVAV